MKFDKAVFVAALTTLTFATGACDSKKEEKKEDKAEEKKDDKAEEKAEEK